MCLCEPLSTATTFLCRYESNDNYDGYDFDLEEDQYPGDHPAILFSEICNRIELDREWLNAAPRSEPSLLLRYFGDQVRSLVDLIDFRVLLHECLEAVRSEAA